jgi:hypothetical protein
MKKSVYYNDFVQEFIDYNREDSFSREALELIYDSLICYEEDTGEEIELDVIYICGKYSEEDILEFAKRELDINDLIYEEEDEEEIFDFSTYEKRVDELVFNIPNLYVDFTTELYKDYKIIGNKKVRREDEESYFRILLIGILAENGEWIDSSNVYLVTDLDYSFAGIALTNEEAKEIGEQLPVKEVDKVNIEEKSWEDIDFDVIRKAVEDDLVDRGCFVGFTSKDTVVYQDY